MAKIFLTRGQRLDQYVIEHHPRLSRAFAVKLIESGKVLVNGGSEKPGYKTRLTDDIFIDFDESTLDIIPNINLPIIYEDADVVVIDKPAGVISHARGRYWDEPSVASFVRSRVTDESDLLEQPSEPTRAGIVHRLDRATSGVMICSKNAHSLKVLQKQFGDRSVSKQYVAVVSGHISPDEAIIDIPIERNPKAPSTFRAGSDGKPAQTTYHVETHGKEHDFVLLKPHTGRTHQLRVHLAYIKHPIVGDTLYNGQEASRLYLHAKSLEIVLPSGERKIFEAPVPPEFSEKVRG